jgi:hypothetical protein
LPGGCHLPESVRGGGHRPPSGQPKIRLGPLGWIAPTQGGPVCGHRVVCGRRNSSNAVPDGDFGLRRRPARAICRPTSRRGGIRPLIPLATSSACRLRATLGRDAPYHCDSAQGSRTAALPGDGSRHTRCAGVRQAPRAPAGIQRVASISGARSLTPGCRPRARPRPGAKCSASTARRVRRRSGPLIANWRNRHTRTLAARMTRCRRLRGHVMRRWPRHVIDEPGPVGSTVVARTMQGSCC